MAFGREVWLSGDVGQIKKLESIQYETLKRVVGTYKGTASSVLEKEAAVPPFKIRLEHVLELRLAKIFFRVDNGNFVYERFKFFFDNFSKVGNKLSYTSFAAS